ncbi:MAG: hypothetical protein GWO28_15590 [candidate division Zixibacteria bacterium]|nr:hypothetical protein [candidate division Zixibacteria bacterium]
MSGTEHDCKLISINDLRPIDWFTGKRLPLTEDEAPECDRCGRKHAIVWTVQTPRGIVTVGSSCGPRLLNGWNPEKFELKKARAAMRERAETEKTAKLDSIAQPFASVVSALEMPQPRIAEEQNFPELVEEWQIGDARCSVLLNMKPERPDLDPHESKRMRIEWIRHTISKLVYESNPRVDDEDFSSPRNREIEMRNARIINRAVAIALQD